LDQERGQKPLLRATDFMFALTSASYYFWAYGRGLKLCDVAYMWIGRLEDYLITIRYVSAFIEKSM
jgi:hypothetical protein